MKRWLLVWCGLLASCVSLPKPGKPAMRDVQFRMREFRLANGMRIIVEEDHASPLVGVFTVVGAGSSSDPAGREGLAHFIEHLAFRATPYNRGTAWNQLEGSGVGFLNAQTWFDETTYMEVATKDLLPKLLTLEAGRLLNPLTGVDQKTFDVEREVVRNELRQRGENSMGPAFSSLQAAAFPSSHHYSRPIAGTHESLTAITLDDAKAFAAKHYVPSNLTMLIIGDVDLAHVHETLMKALPMSVFQPLPPTQTPFPSRVSGPQSAPPEPPASRLVRTQSNVATPELFVVWSLPRTFGSETVLLDFVRAAAGRELSSAFMSDPDIASVRVDTVPGVEASLLIASVSLHKGEHVERSYERVLDQLVKIWANDSQRGGFSSAASEALVDELSFIRKRNSAVMSMTLNAEDLLTRGVERVLATHYTGDPLVYTRRLHALAEVKPTEVAHFAETYLKRDRARGVLVEPYPPGSKELGPSATGLAPAASSQLAGSFSVDAVRTLGQAAIEHAKFETVVRATPHHLEETLENGLRVVIHKRENSLPVAVVQLVITTGEAGTAPPGAGRLGTMIAAPRKHAFGQGDEYGIFWGSDLTDDRLTFMASGANGNVANMLAQLSERVTSMHADADQLAFVKTEFATYFERFDQLPAARAERDLKAALFKGHPYAATTTTKDLMKLSAGDVDEWFERALNPKRAVLVVTGDIDAPKTLESVKQFLSAWRAPSKPFDAIAAFAPRHDGAVQVVVTGAPASTQAQLHLACVAPSSDLTAELSNGTLAQLLGTEFFEKIRGELGASYGIHGRSTELGQGLSRLDWAGAIENGRLAQALVAIRTTMQKFAESTLTDSSLERARWAMAREATLDNSSAEKRAQSLVAQTLKGRAASTESFEALTKVDRAHLLEAWSACQGNLVMGLEGDEALIRAAAKEAGLGQ